MKGVAPTAQRRAGPSAAADSPSLLAGIKTVYRSASPQRRRQFFNVMALMLVGGIAELATIGALMPFLTLLANIDSARYGWALPLTGTLSRNGQLLLAAALFIAFAIAAGLVRLQLARLSRKFVYRLGHELTVELQRRVLLQPLSFHVHRNSSTLLTALNKVEALVCDILLPLMLAVSGAVTGLFVVALFLIVDPVATLAVSATLAVTYVVISTVVSKRLTQNSDTIKTAYDERMQIVQESLTGIRDVIIDNSQSMYLGDFAHIDRRLADARAQTQFLDLAPRYIIEMVGMIALAAMAVAISARAGGVASALPVLGALALGAQRLLPLLQDVYRGWAGVRGERSIFDQVVELLSLPVPADEETASDPLELRRSISIEQVSFAYPTRAGAALDGLSLTIPAGSMAALIGPTGSGKSTLVDLLMGLLEPGAGRILIDDVPLTADTRKAWHRSVAHVPQSIFLADASIARNIALSLPGIAADEERIVDAAKRAQLHDFILSLPHGYATQVGERGVRLSGGQRQRLGIARAIYKSTPVLVLDEATSALDEATETALITALDALRREGRTIIIVAHRQSTINHCDLVARLDHGRIAELRTASSQRGTMTAS